MVLFLFVISFLTLQTNAADTKTVIEYAYGSATNQGKKCFMEDRVVLETNSKYPIIGVLDGHGGSFAVDNVLKSLQEYTHQEPIIEPTENAIINFFHTTNNTLRELSAHDEFKQTSGSTASIAFMHDTTLYCAQLGDSAIIDHKGELVLPAHGLKNTEERARVGEHNFSETSDGERFGRELLMTRAFGDFSLTKNGLIAKPEIKKIQLNPTEFLIFATDGVSDELPCNIIAEYVEHRVREKINLSRIARELILLAASDTLHTKYRTPESIGRASGLIKKMKECSDQIFHTHYEFKNMQERAYDNQAVVIVHRKS